VKRGLDKNFAQVAYGGHFSQKREKMGRRLPSQDEGILIPNNIPPSRKKREKGGATANWEFNLKGWARRDCARTYSEGCPILVASFATGWDSRHCQRHPHPFTFQRGWRALDFDSSLIAG
jgi:hypothetical protein